MYRSWYNGEENAVGCTPVEFVMWRGRMMYPLGMWVGEGRRVREWEEWVVVGREGKESLESFEW